jgi:hypothetical protein
MYPYPSYEQNQAVYSHLFNMTNQQQLLDAGVRVLSSQEAYITKTHGSNNSDLR